MRIFKHIAAFLAAAVVAMTAMTGVASADAFTDARNAGLIGERPDGYAAIVNPGSAPASITQLVDSINAQRRAHYEKIAAETGADAQAVGQVTAQQLYAAVPPGTFLMSQSGEWAQK